MVCPGEQGAQSQRRLNHISERLWDYQLRGIGACSILFSWGGVEVQDQPLAEGDRFRHGTHARNQADGHPPNPHRRIDRLSDPISFSGLLQKPPALLGGFWSFLFVDHIDLNRRAA